MAATADSNNIVEEVDTITREDITRTEIGAVGVDTRTIGEEEDIKTTAAVAVTKINSSAVEATEMTVEEATVGTTEDAEETVEEVVEGTEVISLLATNNDFI